MSPQGRVEYRCRRHHHVRMILTDTFNGFVRPDGSVGVRNHLLVMSVTGLTGPTARRIAAIVADTVVVDYPYGTAAMTPIGGDGDLHDRALVGFATNPNVGAVLIIGANPPRTEALAERIAVSGKPVRAITLDECGHDAITLTERGLRMAAELAKALSRQRREPVPTSALYVALECGRSDPSSGLVTNPLMGLIADAMVDLGGCAIIGESTEWLGAEHLLAARAVSDDVRDDIMAAARRREQLAVDAGIDLTGNNPDPTNIAGGLSTIEEKSLGNIAKSGSRPIQSVVRWAEPPSSPGMHLMDAAAYAPESLSGFAASGAQLMLFSTGVGNSYVNSISPTLKLSANPETCERLGQQLDFACPELFQGGKTLEQAAEQLGAVILDVASGTRTWGEILGEGGEAFTRLGESL
jgi:altronate dehydratase large subunit